MTPRCTYRGCITPPIRRLTPSNGARPWLGCAAHYPRMVDALNIGLPGATTGTGWVEVTELDERQQHG